MTQQTYKSPQRLTFREFTKEDYYGFGGAESEAGMPPMIGDNLDENLVIITYTTCEIHTSEGKIYSRTIGRDMNSSYSEYLAHLDGYTDDMITEDWLDRNGFNYIGDAY